MLVALIVRQLVFECALRVWCIIAATTASTVNGLQFILVYQCMFRPDLSCWIGLTDSACVS